MRLFASMRRFLGGRVGLLLAASLLCLQAPTAFSQVPSGQFSYSFNVPNGTLLSTHAPELVADPHLVIQNNRLNGSLTWWGAATLVHPNVTANQLVQFRIAGAVNGYTYISLRASNSNRYFVQFTSNSVALYKGVGTNQTLLNSTPTTVATGDVIRVTAVGSELRVLINNQLRIAVNDTSFPTGSVGFALYDASNALDDLMIGSFSVATSPPPPLPPAMPTVNITPTPNPPSTAAFVNEFAQAKPFANNQNAQVPNFLSPGSASNVVPHYGGSTPQTGLFAQGQGATAAPGVGRAVDCEINPQTGTPYNLQECEAIRFMRQSPSARPQFNVNRANAFIAGTEAYKADPALALGPNALAGSYSACTTSTQTTPPSTRTEICHDHSTISDTICSVGRTITVDPHHLYQCVEQLFTLTAPTCTVPREIDFDIFQNWQCAQSPNTLNTQTCRRTLLVSITTQDNCELATVIHQAALPFEYDFRRGLDLYTTGGVARVMCNFLTEDKIDLRMFYGDVVQGQYGSGATYQPPPDLNLLPNTLGPLEVYINEPVERQIGQTGGQTIWVTGGCSVSPFRPPSCSFTINIHQQYSTYQSCNDNGCVDVPACTVDALGRCARLESTQLNFTKPSRTAIISETFDNQCVALEARQ